MSGETYFRKHGATKQTVALHLEIEPDQTEELLEQLKDLLAAGNQLEIRPRVDSFFVDFTKLEVFDT